MENSFLEQTHPAERIESSQNFLMFHIFPFHHPFLESLVIAEMLWNGVAQHVQNVSERIDAAFQKCRK